MWTMTTTGFTSAVLHKTLKDHLIVRGRDHESLEDLAHALGLRDDAIYTDFPSDYPYRVAVSKEDYKWYMSAKIDAMDYHNFKDAATAKRGNAYHDVLMRVWVVMLSLTPASVKAENEAAWNIPLERGSDEWFPLETTSSFRRKKGKKGKRALATRDKNDKPVPFLSMTDQEWNALQEENI